MSHAAVEGAVSGAVESAASSAVSGAVGSAVSGVSVCPLAGGSITSMISGRCRCTSFWTSRGARPSTATPLTVTRSEPLGSPHRAASDPSVTKQCTSVVAAVKCSLMPTLASTNSKARSCGQVEGAFAPGAAVEGPAGAAGVSKRRRRKSCGGVAGVGVEGGAPATEGGSCGVVAGVGDASGSLAGATAGAELSEGTYRMDAGNMAGADAVRGSWDSERVVAGGVSPRLLRSSLSSQNGFDFCSSLLPNEFEEGVCML